MPDRSGRAEWPRNDEQRHRDDPSRSAADDGARNWRSRSVARQPRREHVRAARERHKGAWQHTEELLGADVARRHEERDDDETCEPGDDEEESETHPPIQPRLAHPRLVGIGFDGLIGIHGSKGRTSPSGSLGISA